MNIYGFEQELGASYGAKRLCDNEDVYGIGIIKVDDLKINISVKSKNSGIEHCIKYKGENRRWFK